MSIQKTTRENPQPIDSAVRPALAPPPDAQLLRLILGSFVSRALAVAAELNVADLLKEGPMSLKSSTRQRRRTT